MKTDHPYKPNDWVCSDSAHYGFLIGIIREILNDYSCEVIIHGTGKPRIWFFKNIKPTSKPTK